MSSKSFVGARDKSAKVVCVSSGKGGVGKTMTVIHLAAHAAKLGKKVLLVDGDLGMANVDIVLGLRPRYNISDVCSGRACFGDILMDGPLGIKIASSGSGITSLQSLTFCQKQLIADELKGVEEQFDLIIFDSGSGIGGNVIYMNKLSTHSVIVTTPEPHALTDAYALVKELHRLTGINSVDLIMNLCASMAEGHEAAKRFIDVCLNYLTVRVNLLGVVPDDPRLGQQIIRRSLISPESMHSLSAEAWFKCGNELSENIDRKDPDQCSFFEALIGGHNHLEH